MERLRRRATRLILGLARLSYEEGLKESEGNVGRCGVGVQREGRRDPALPGNTRYLCKLLIKKRTKIVLEDLINCSHHSYRLHKYRKTATATPMIRRGTSTAAAIL